MTQKGEKRGEFPVARVRIIEKVPDSTFQYPYCFQVYIIIMFVVLWILLRYVAMINSIKLAIDW